MKVIPPITITESGAFSRASTATYFDSTGQLATAAVDELRYSYDPANLLNGPKILIEPVAANILLYSEDLTNSAWITNAPSIISATSPSGAFPASLISYSAANAQTYQVSNVSPSTIYTFSYLVELGTKSSNSYAIYDQTNLAFIVVSTIATEVRSTGLARITVTFTTPALCTQVRCYPDRNDTAVSGSIFVGCCQLELGSIASSYIKTLAAPVTRAADIYTKQVNSNVVGAAPAVYNAGTTYADGATVSVSGTLGNMICFESLQNSNLGNTPGASPLFWKYIGNTYATYSASTSYALSFRVQDNDTYKIYESLQAANIGHLLTDTAWWLEIGPTNNWAMFDLLRNTQTSRIDNLIVSLNPGERVDSLALLGLVANHVSVSVEHDGIEVYNYSQSLDTRQVSNWYEYFFNTFSTQKSFVLFDLPPYVDAIISITLTVTSGYAKCGAIVIGLQQDLGGIQYNAVSDVLNFSTVNRDFAGGTSLLVQRRNVPKTISNIQTPKAWLNRIRDTRDLLNASPAVWSGLDDNLSEYFESFLILGYYKKFSINASHPEDAIISLEIEEI
jgi:hypothetical protein